MGRASLMLKVLHNHPSPHPETSEKNPREGATHISLQQKLYQHLRPNKHQVSFSVVPGSLWTRVKRQK